MISSLGIYLTVLAGARCMRCLQANLAYLAAIADRAHKPTSTIPPSPAIMTAPRSVSSLSEHYRNLSLLFPGVNPMTSNPPKMVGPSSGVGSQASGSVASPPSTDGAAGPQAPTGAIRSGPSQAEKNYKRWLEEASGGREGSQQWEQQVQQNQQNQQQQQGHQIQAPPPNQNMSQAYQP